MPPEKSTDPMFRQGMLGGLILKIVALGPVTNWLRVSLQYFATLGTRLLRGRFIDDQDTATSRRVAVVGDAFVHKFFAEKVRSGSISGRCRPFGDLDRGAGRSYVWESDAAM